MEYNREIVEADYERYLKRRPLVIDCDTGTDDGIMLIAALGCGAFDIRGITSASGNVEQQFTSANNLNLAEYLNWDVPVYRGAYESLYPGKRARSAVHGAEGLGDVTIPAARMTTLEDETAPEAIYRIAKEEDGNLELLITGPMTNVAIALMLYPELKTLIRRITFMGGAMEKGNVVPHAEFNIWFDPPAAHIVFTSGIPLLMIGLDVTERALLIDDDRKFFAGLHTRAGSLAAGLLDFMLRREDNGLESAYMHDGLALAACADPLCVTTKKAHIAVEALNDALSGKTYVKLDPPESEVNAEVAVDLYFHRFRVWLHEAVSGVKDIPVVAQKYDLR